MLKGVLKMIMKEKYMCIFVILVGVYIALDGFGSILVYPEQPFFPDQVIRLIRVVLGVAIALVAGSKFATKD
jgi:hypothetical protein